MSSDKKAAPTAADSDLEILKRRAESLASEETQDLDEQSTGILLFESGEEWYGVHVASVREIHNDYVISPIPCVPDFILGVVNIRGEIVSVTDLRAMMGLGRTASGAGAEQAPVIVVCDEAVCTALVVDAIGDIADVGADRIEPPLAAGDKTQSGYIAGTFYVDGRLAALVDLTRVLTPIASD